MRNNAKCPCFSFVWVCVLFTITGCASSSSSLPFESQTFLYPSLFSPYRAYGRILLSNQKDTQSGELQLNMKDSSELQMQIFAPVLGTLLYELRVNEQEFMILDYRNRRYFFDVNQKESRTAWMGMDLHVKELSWILWGRIPHQAFEEFNGTFTGSRQLKMERLPVIYEITLNEEGLMESLTKAEDNLTLFQVQISAYQNLGALRLPKKIKITQTTGDNKLIFALTEVDLLKIPQAPLIFRPPKDMLPML